MYSLSQSVFGFVPACGSPLGKLAHYYKEFLLHCLNFVPLGLPSEHRSNGLSAIASMLHYARLGCLYEARKERIPGLRKRTQLTTPFPPIIRALSLCKHSALQTGHKNPLLPSTASAEI